MPYIMDGAPPKPTDDDARAVRMANSFGEGLRPFLVSASVMRHLREASERTGIALSEHVILYPRMPTRP